MPIRRSDRMMNIFRFIVIRFILFIVTYYVLKWVSPNGIQGLNPLFHMAHFGHINGIYPQSLNRVFFSRLRLQWNWSTSTLTQTPQFWLKPPSKLKQISKFMIQLLGQKYNRQMVMVTSWVIREIFFGSWANHLFADKRS